MCSYLFNFFCFVFIFQVRTCEHIPQSPILFSSPQCFGYRSEYGPATKEACFPSKNTIILQIRRVLRSMKHVTSIFIASDNNHMVHELKAIFKNVCTFYVTTIDILGNNFDTLKDK